MARIDHHTETVEAEAARRIREMAKSHRVTKADARAIWQDIGKRDRDSGALCRSANGAYLEGWYHEQF